MGRKTVQLAELQDAVLLHLQQTTKHFWQIQNCFPENPKDQYAFCLPLGNVRATLDAWRLRRVPTRCVCKTAVAAR